MYAFQAQFNLSVIPYFLSVYLRCQDVLPMSQKIVRRFCPEAPANVFYLERTTECKKPLQVLRPPIEGSIN